MITKNQIKLIKSLRLKKNRIQSGFFIAEGEKIIDEFLDSKLEVVNIFSTLDKYNISDYFISLCNKETRLYSVFL